MAELKTVQARPEAAEARMLELETTERAPKTEAEVLSQLRETNSHPGCE